LNRALGLALLVVGAALIFYGIQASESIGSDFSRFFTGSPTDKTLWLLIGGLAVSAAGVLALLRRKA
jgi:LPXTG-motif cell wall-anchored protein